MSTAHTAVPCTLWGLPHSLYAGKVRSYLIKKGIPFKEMVPAHPDFGSRIVPGVGHVVVPVVELEDGTLLQDTTVIIEYFEGVYPQGTMIPQTPVMKVLAWLLSAYGSEGLLPAAMHYRWSYRENQETFLRSEFGRGVHHGPDRDERRTAGAGLMKYFNGMLPPLGVTPETAPVIEQCYLELLDVLDIHLQAYPYMLGGLPSIADFGLMAPLYAHLSRDPVPAQIMKTRAPNVFRWTERMNTPGNFDGEFYDCAQGFFTDDALPESLQNILTYVFQDWGPELLANAAIYQQWLAENLDRPAGTIVSASGETGVHPTLGKIQFLTRGVTIEKNSASQTLWHFAKVLAAAAELDGESADAFAAVVQEAGGSEVMALSLPRAIERRNNSLVLA